MNEMLTNHLIVAYVAMSAIFLLWMVEVTNIEKIKWRTQTHPYMRIAIYHTVLLAFSAFWPLTIMLALRS